MKKEHHAPWRLGRREECESRKEHAAASSELITSQGVNYCPSLLVLLVNRAPHPWPKEMLLGARPLLPSSPWHALASPSVRRGLRHRGLWAAVGISRSLVVFTWMAFSPQLCTFSVREKKKISICFGFRLM